MPKGARELVKTFLFFVSILGSLPASASPATSCQDLEKAFKADQMKIGTYRCESSDLRCQNHQIDQLRKTISAFVSDPNAETKTGAQLTTDYRPTYLIYTIGTDRFEAVKIRTESETLTTFYRPGTTDLADLRITNESVMAGRESCRAVFKPVINDLRLQHICEAIVTLLSGPEPKFTLDACLKATKEKTLDLYIVHFTDDLMDLRVQRNLSDLGGGYFACDVQIDRRDSAVVDSECFTR